jgi:D-xylose transport system permease protein
LSGRALRSYGLIAALIVVWLVFAWVTNGIFLTPRNFSNLMRQTAVTGILAVGMVMVIITGQIDLSVGSIVGLSGMAAVLVQVSLHAGLLASLLTGILVGLAIGMLQGALTAYARIPSFIVTLGGLLAWRGVAKGISGGNTYPIAVRAFKSLGQAYLSPTTGIVLIILGVIAAAWLAIRQNQARVAHGAVAWSPLAFLLRVLGPAAVIAAFVLALNEYAGVPAPVLILAGVALAGAFVTRNTVFGRYLYAIGGNPEAARLSGINGRAHVLWTFSILGVLAALAGMIYTARVGSAGPDAGALLELDAIAACVIGGASLMGGRGTVLGACLGALFMASLDNGMSLKNVPDFIQDIVKGGILVSAVGLDMIGRRRD